MSSIRIDNTNAKSNKELFELPDIVEKGWFGRKKVRPNPGKTPFIKVNGWTGTGQTRSSWRRKSS